MRCSGFIVNRCHVFVEGSALFCHFPYAINSTDVKFQQSNRSTGTIEKIKDSYSRKHKPFGYKEKVSVLSSDLALNCTSHARGKFSNISIFCGNLEFRYSALAESPEEAKKVDVGVLSAEYSDLFAVLVGRRYQDPATKIRTIHTY